MKFSVIVPIYNVEPYLRECIDSVLAQTCQDFELILVDDGSPDGSPAICDEYAARDERIQVIHKPNGGLVSARQAGVQTATGDYVVCLDADDCIQPAMLEKAAALCQEAPDMIVFGIKYFSAAGSREVYDFVAEGWYDRAAMEKSIFPCVLMDERMKYMVHYLCGKVIRRSVYLKHQMTVDRRLSLGEDVACLMPVYMDAQKLYVSHECMYCVREREASITRRFSLKQFDQLVIGIDDLRKYGNEPITDFPKQVDRYSLLAVLVQLVNAVEYNGRDQLDGLCKCVRHPAIWSGVQNAVYTGVTPRSWVTYKLLRGGRIKTAYWFLVFCEWLKRMMKKK